MTGKTVDQNSQDAKKERLARALRENLKKRKSQRRERTAEADKTVKDH